MLPAATPTMPVSQIRPGMAAVGKSVFWGTKIEPFNMKILGVMHRARQGRDVIMAQVLDGPVVAAQSGVLAGMSGSPVYINGRLIGAIAFSWPFSKEAIAGITPIADMLETIRPAAGQERPAAATTSQLDRPLIIGGKAYRRVTVETSPKVGKPEAGTITLRPTNTILLASGFGERGMKRLGELFAPFGAEVVQGVGGVAEENLPVGLEPGAAVGIQLVKGDFDVSAFGTVTWREGDQILAFGHPMLSLGNASLPMATGLVHGFVPSYNVSFKLGAAISTVGAINQDRLWAIGGTVGQTARMTPVTITVGDGKGGKPQTYRLQVVRDRRLAPGLIMSCVMDAVDDSAGYVGRGTARVEFTLAAEGKYRVSRTDLVYGEDASAAATLSLMEPIGLLANSPYGGVELDSAQINVTMVPERRTAVIREVAAERPTVKAGEKVKLTLQVEPYGKEPVTRTMELAVPSDMPSGTLRIGVAGGAEAERLKSMLGLPRPVVKSLDQSLGEYERRCPANQIVLMAALPSRGVSVDGRLMPTLPQGMVSLFEQAKSSRFRPEPDRIETRVPEPEWVVTGYGIVTVRVQERPGMAGRRSAAPSTSAGPSQAPEESEAEGEEGAEEPGSRALIPLSFFDMSPVNLAADGETTEAGEADREETDAATAAGTTTKKAETPRPLSREPETWLHAGAADFQAGELAGVTLDAKGRLALGKDLTTLGTLGAEMPLALAVSGEAVYAGTAGNGRVYRLKGGKAEPFFDTGAVMATALLPMPDGTLYVGAGPGGKLWKVAPDGKGTMVLDTEREYVWALCSDGQGGLWAASGPPARLWHLPANGQPRGWDVEATHLLSLVAGKNGEVYAGSADNGVVFRVAHDGALQTALGTDDSAVTALAMDAKGALWAGTSPRGTIYRMSPGEAPVKVAETGATIYALAACPDGVYATGKEGTLTAIGLDDVPSLCLKPKEGQVISLAAGQQGALLLGLANPGSVMQFGPGYARTGTYVSPVLDARQVARWGVAGWQQDLPGGTAAALETRSGNGPNPEEGWSNWSGPYPSASGSTITSPQARYLQYRLTLTSGGVATPIVQAVQITYLGRNNKPRVTVSVPKPGTDCAKSLKVSWKGEDPDKDTLLYRVEWSNDRGATWKVLKDEQKESTYTWDLSKVAEGSYLLRITASDRLSRPADPEEASATVPFQVDASPPTVIILRQSVQATEGAVTVRGTASDKLGVVRAVDWRVDGGDWKSAALGGEQVEGPSIEFSFTTGKLSPGKHKVEARAFDRAGNLGTDTYEVTVPQPKKPVTAGG